MYIIVFDWLETDKFTSNKLFYMIFPVNNHIATQYHYKNSSSSLYPPQTLFVVGILFSRCPSVRPSVRASVRNVLFP